MESFLNKFFPEVVSGMKSAAASSPRPRVDSSWMAGGAFEVADVHSYDGSLTAAVMAICLMAASCGLVFGYHVGVAGK